MPVEHLVGMSSVAKTPISKTCSHDVYTTVLDKVAGINSAVTICMQIIIAYLPSYIAYFSKYIYIVYTWYAPRPQDIIYIYLYTIPIYALRIVFLVAPNYDTTPLGPFVHFL